MKALTRWTFVAICAFMVSACYLIQPKEFPVEKLEPELQAVLDKANSDAAFNDSDIALVVRGSKVAEIINSINTIPAVNRQINFQVLRGAGKLTDEADYYLELFDLPENRASGEIRQITANWTPEGKLAIDAVLAVTGNFKIHGHYKPLATGGRVGATLGATTTLRGRLAFERDPKELVAAKFELDPAEISYSIGSSIKDKKELCYRIEYPCFTGKCEAKDCKTLWSYEIPIGFRDTVKISGSLIKLPVQIGMPKEFSLSTKVGETEFKKNISVEITPSGFTSDAHGIFLKAKVAVKQLPL